MKVLIILLALLLPSYSNALELSKKEIIKDGAFEGMNLEIKGDRKQNTNIAIIITGPKEEYKIIKKEKFGFVWINSKSYTVNEIESYFKVIATAPIHAIATKEERDSLGLYLEEKSFHIKEQNNQQVHSELFEAFNRYKINHGEYSGLESLIPTLTEAMYSTTLHLTKEVRAGVYEVKEYTFDNLGNLMNLEQDYFVITQIGLAEMLKNAALQQPLFYSILTIGMALIIGALTGYIFYGVTWSKKQRGSRY